MPGLLAHRYAVAPTALLLAFSLAWLTGCSDDTAEPSSSDPTSSASGSATSPSPSPSATEPSRPPEPELPKAPAAKNTDAGRKAFAEFVVARWGYALRTNEAAALSDLSPRSAPCGGCVKLAAELRKREKEGWYVDFPGAKVTKVEVVPGELPGVHVATARIDVPASQSYFEDGELRNENEARKGATFEVRMRLDGKRFVLLAFRVG
jgi:Family of unknown function (DUF6318)